MMREVWQPPAELPAGMRWSARSRSLAYSASGRSWRLHVPVLAVQTAPWRGLDGRVRFGLHRAAVVDLYAAAVELAAAADPFWKARSAAWRGVTREVCWQTAVRIYDRGAVIQDCLDALDPEPALPADSATAGRPAAALSVWATVEAAVGLGEQCQRP